MASFAILALSESFTDRSEVSNFAFISSVGRLVLPLLLHLIVGIGAVVPLAWLRCYWRRSTPSIVHRHRRTHSAQLPLLLLCLQL